MNPRDSLVSIIMPAHNAEHYIGEAIDSVLAQTHSHWELIVVIDGSKDRTAEIVQAYEDDRIRCIVRDEQKGVSAARNVGLEKIKGSFLLFLDADDLLFSIALERALQVFEKDPELAFVDGGIRYTNCRMDDVVATWTPAFEGWPKKELLQLNYSCFAGLTWMIRWVPGQDLFFDEALTHCEDIDFFTSLADQGKYGYVNQELRIVRDCGYSAMDDIQGLESSYRKWVEKLLRLDELSSNEARSLIRKVKKILFRSYLKKGKFLRAFRSQKDWPRISA